jgi:oligopeptide/dipeptide ABC transporter ATP-binding protein
VSVPDVMEEMIDLGTDDRLLRVEHLGVHLPTEAGEVTVVDDVSLDVAPGEVVGLAGESGSGKTMTALAIMGLLPQRARVEGRIVLEGRDLLQLPKRQLRKVRGDVVAMVFQDPMSCLHPAYTTGEQIAEALRAHRRISRAEAMRIAISMLDRVGIPDAAKRARQYPFEFSGGMQQRVMIAMALALEPRLLIADEPTTALDVTVQAQVLDLIASLQVELSMAVLFVSHDLGVVSELCERVVVMYAGQVIEDSPSRELFRRPLHPYAQALIVAAPHPALKGTELPTIPGAPPLPGLLPDGCRFHPRCDFCQPERCTDHEIAVQVVEGRAVRCVRATELDLATTQEAGRG